MVKKQFREVNLNNAILFAAVMEYEDTCNEVLKLILGHTVEVEEVHTEVTKVLDSGLRGIRLDVYARDDNNVRYNLEMQNGKTNVLPKRSRFYQSIIDAHELKPGEDFGALPPNYIIFICTKDPFGDKLYRYTFENRCIENGKPLGDGTYKIFLNTKGTNKDAVPESLVQFLNYIENSTDSFVSTVSDQSIVKIHERVKLTRNNSDWRNWYMTLGEFLDQLAHEEGFEEGREKGREEGWKLNCTL